MSSIIRTIALFNTVIKFLVTFCNYYIHVLFHSDTKSLFICELQTDAPNVLLVMREEFD